MEVLHNFQVYVTVYLFAMKSLGQAAIQFYRLLSPSKEYVCPFVLYTTWNCNLTGLQTTLDSYNKTNEMH